MVAVAAEQVVGRALEFLRCFADDGLEIWVWPEREALEKFAAECAPWRFLPRSCPVHAGHAGSIMPAERVFAVQAFNYDASMQERATEKPQRRRKFSRLSFCRQDGGF